jgi:hypothetical protein
LKGFEFEMDIVVQKFEECERATRSERAFLGGDVEGEVGNVVRKVGFVSKDVRDSLLGKHQRVKMLRVSQESGQNSTWASIRVLLVLFLDNRA